MQEIDLTKSEGQLYNIIVNYIKEKQYSPSIRELCELAGYKSTSSIHNKIQRLIEKGLYYYGAWVS
jgi:LexA DNA binding domain.